MAMLIFGIITGCMCTDAILTAVQQEQAVVQLAQVRCCCAALLHCVVVQAWCGCTARAAALLCCCAAVLLLCCCAALLCCVMVQAWCCCAARAATYCTHLHLHAATTPSACAAVAGLLSCRWPACHCACGAQAHVPPLSRQQATHAVAGRTDAPAPDLLHHTCPVLSPEPCASCCLPLLGGISTYACPLYRPWRLVVHAIRAICAHQH